MTDDLDFFGQLDDSGSAERARDEESMVAPVDHGGPFIVGFHDGDDIHEVTLRRDGDDWRGDCWALHDDGERRERCRGLVYSDGPCAHLYAVRQAVADDDRDDVTVRDDAEARAEHHVERIMADGGPRWGR